MQRQIAGADEGDEILDRHHPSDEPHPQRRGTELDEVVVRRVVVVDGRQRRRVVGEVDTVGDDLDLGGGSAVGDLLDAVDLGERHDAPGLRVRQARQRAEESRPDLAQRRDVRRPGGRAQAEAAVVGLRRIADPVGARQLHLALARVDAVLGEGQRALRPPAPDGGQQARVPGGDRVVAGRRHDRCGEEPQHRDVDGAEVPEEIEERRLGRGAIGELGQQIEAGATVEQLVERRDRWWPDRRGCSAAPPNRRRRRGASGAGRPARATAARGCRRSFAGSRICSRRSARAAPSSGGRAVSWQKTRCRPTTLSGSWKRGSP